MSKWTHAKNERRCFLISKAINDSLTPDEKAELDQLQAEVVREIPRFTPEDFDGLGDMLKDLRHITGKR